MFTNQDNFYRHQYDDISLLSISVDKRIKESYMANKVIGIDPHVDMIFGRPSEGMDQYNLITRTFYFSSEGLVEAGSADEAPLLHGNSAFDTKQVSLGERHGRVLFSRSELKYKDRLPEVYAKTDSVLIGAVSKFHNSLSQAAADMAFNRGWELSYTDAFGKVVSGRDMDGTNPYFAYNHRIAGGAHIVNNLCIRENANGSITLNPVLSDTAILDTFQYSRRVRDMSGVSYGTTRNLNTIVCSDRQARNLIQWKDSQFEPHSANNGVNVFPLILPNIQYFTWYRLYMDGQGNLTNPTTNTKYADHWYMVDLMKAKENFHLQILEPATIKKEISVGNSENVAFFTRPAFRMWYTGTDGIFGSNGSENPAPADFPRI